jgi:hypothetical protein
VFDIETDRIADLQDLLSVPEIDSIPLPHTEKLRLLNELDRTYGRMDNLSRVDEKDIAGEKGRDALEAARETVLAERRRILEQLGLSEKRARELLGRSE